MNMRQRLASFVVAGLITVNVAHGESPTVSDKGHSKTGKVTQSTSSSRKAEGQSNLLSGGATTTVFTGFASGSLDQAQNTNLSPAVPAFSKDLEESNSFDSLLNHAIDNPTVAGFKAEKVERPYSPVVPSNQPTSIVCAVGDSNSFGLYVTSLACCIGAYYGARRFKFSEEAA